MTRPAGTVPGTPLASPADLVRRPAMTSRIEPSLEFEAMGGRVHLRIACPPWQAERAAADLRLVAGRIAAWASRLSRFDPASELSRLNRSPAAPMTPVGPTLGSVLRLARAMAERTEGSVDVGLLAARIAAETGGECPAPPAGWMIRAQARGSVVERRGPVTFDLDGVGKGWIADRALGLLREYPAALVDADGDIAVRSDERTAWTLAVADPRVGNGALALLHVAGRAGAQRLGVATSGTSVHRWRDSRGSRHHLIDPGTGRPARTDIVQATVVARSALLAESLAKAIVIRGSETGLGLSERADVLAAVVLLEDGQVRASPRSLAWLA